MRRRGLVLWMGLPQELDDAEIGIGMKDLTLGEIAQLGGACAQAEPQTRGSVVGDLQS